MSQSTSRGVRCVGDYVVGRQIGSGSFSVVWHGKHKVTGADVAIKEIVTGRLNKKLHESLMSEIRILKHIENPNIIRLHDIIEETGRVHLILEYCKGGDLFMFIQQRQGKISEGTAKFFMQQLASGLQILRQNNLIHRDLKPQNLLLSTNRETAILKIADFGFARSLDPRNLAETLCGSPLYMAPEIMQLQKYDAKADLWSVGAILFQLVTGKPPFTGNNQIQLLQNIIKSTELQFPPDKNNLSSDCMDLCRKLLRRNPVERLTFEEFFNHPFLSQKQSDESFRNRRSPRSKDPVKKAEESSQLDCLPFSIDDDIRGVEGNSSFGRRPSMKSTYGFSVDNKADNKVTNTQDNMDIVSSYSALKHKGENTSFGVDRLKPVEGKLKESFKSADQRPLSTLSKVADSLDLIDQDYVIVSGPPLDISSSSQTASKLIHLPCVVENTQQVNTNVKSMSSAPQPIIGIPISRNLESHGSSVPSQGSSDLGDALEQPSTNCLTRIKSLKRFAAAIKELVNEKIEGGRQLEAFSIELVILAIWKQALHICHTQAIEGSPTTHDVGSLKESNTNMHDCVGSSGSAITWDPQDMCSQIEKEFLAEVGNAEELAKVIDTGNTDMPDAMETIYQSALTLGKNGALDEYMGFPENSAANYTKAVRLFVFLLNEAPTLILTPPFSLTSSDRYRLRTYIDVLNNRQSHSRSQRMALLKCEDQQGPP